VITHSLEYSQGQVQRSSVLGNGWISPVWSPDGRRIAFYTIDPIKAEQRTDERASLQVANADGSGSDALTDLVRGHDQNAPVWSPSGDKIAYETIDAPVSGIGAPSEVYVVNADGSGKLNLTNHPAWDGSPSLSPEGRLAFVSERDGNMEIYTVSLNGTGLMRLTHDTGTDFAPSWSPDGSQIAFISSRDRNLELYVMKADGSGQTNLTRHPGGDFTSPQGSPPVAWSADGKKLAFLSDRDGNIEVYAVNTDGTGLLRMTRSPQLEVSPRWSADGACVTFWADSAIWVVGVDGSGPTQPLSLR
jgi:Tol biopolymer transport system component